MLQVNIGKQFMANSIKKEIALLGSTGSIGVQTLQVVDQSSGSIGIRYLSTNTKIDLLAQQIQKYNPKRVVITDYNKFKEFKERYSFDCEVLFGEDGLCQIASDPSIEITVVAIVGFSGVKPTISALESGKTVALANKETIVAAGSIIKEITNSTNARIISIDSEHNAILQCLIGEDKSSIEKIILTASGGPFLNSHPSSFENVQVSEALAHPKWNMGKKVSIDSATLMNKGLEVIEAYWLFDVPPENIQVLIHPESIIHSLVQFIDGSINAQLGPQDMRIPISYALNYPNRFYYNFPRLNLIQEEKLTFFEPDSNKFPCLTFAYDALKQGGTAPAVLNSANEIAVNAFLEGKISFARIPHCIDFALEKIEHINKPSLDDIFATDIRTRELIEDFINKLS
jgi:1-deoxy-D-xylulose-5-phosphate reductoisomerase